MRRGVTPVVAVVLLLGMTVAVSGGAYAWIQQVQRDAQQGAGGDLATEVAVQDVMCRGEHVEVALKNRGDTDLDPSRVSIYVYDGDRLIGDATQDLSGASFAAAGGFGRARATIDTFMNISTAYGVEIDFRNDGYRVEASCTGEPARTCQDIHGMGFEENGTYTVDPDGRGGVAPFDVSCDMDTDGGGWVKLRIANDCNNDNMFWFSKYNGIDDQEATHGPIGDQFDWGLLAHLDSQDDLVGGSCGSSTNQEGFDWVFTGGPVEERVEWHQWGDASNTYTDAQMDALRSAVTELSETTEAFAHTNDDDNCDLNGEWYLKPTSTGAGNAPRYQITHFSSGNQASAYAIETVAEMAAYNDVDYLIPSYLDRYNSGSCSGEVDHASFGYERNYTLVR